MTLKLFDDTPVAGESPSGVIHQCDFCGNKGRWTDRWSWYGSVMDYDAGIIIKCCGGCGLRDETDGEQLLKQKRRARGLGPRARRKNNGYTVE